VLSLESEETSRFLYVVQLRLAVGRRGRVWCSLELITEVHFDVHCVLNLSFLVVVGVVPWIEDGHPWLRYE
jgi:hypothetical protein